MKLTLNPEWLAPGFTPGSLYDAVRKALLDSLDPDLAYLGWEPHRYDFRLREPERAKVDKRFRDSWLCQTFGLDVLRPSAMTDDDHACTLGGFAQWCDQLIEEGHEIQCV